MINNHKTGEGLTRLDFCDRLKELELEVCDGNRDVCRSGASGGPRPLRGRQEQEEQKQEEPARPFLRLASRVKPATRRAFYNILCLVRKRWTYLIL